MKKKRYLYFIILSLLLIQVFSGCIQEEETYEYSFQEISTDELVGFWMFDETSSWIDNESMIVDSSPYSNNAASNGSTQEKQGINENPCAFFNGYGNYIKIDNAPIFEPQILSVELWAKSSNPGESFSYLLAKGAQNCDWASYAIFTDDNNGICFYISSESQVIKSPNPGSNIWDGQWHHIVGTYDQTTVRLYIDGVEIQDGTQTNSSILYNLSHSNDLIIGNFLGSCKLPYSGYIDNVLIWNKVLTDEEIYQHYVLGSQLTSSPEDGLTPVSYQTARSEIRKFFEPYSANDMLIIKGNGLSVQDNLILTTVASQMENAENIRRVTDLEIVNKSIDEYGLLILLGSEKTNTYVEQMIDSSEFIGSSSIISRPFILHFGHNSALGKEVLIVYLVSEKSNLHNYASEKSPLSSFIDKKYVPIVATSSTILLLYLWSLFGNTISEFIFDFISEHVAERKIKKLRKYVKKRELTKRKLIVQESFALILAILIFSVAISWSWSEDNAEFKSLILTNLILISLVFIVRESIRLRLSKKYEINTAHIFWPFGAILTLGSTILGNTFSLASFTMLENEEKKKMFGKMYYFIFKVLYVIGLCCFIINFFYPSIVFQMIFVFIMMSIVIDMTPVEPMDGVDVRIWNKRKWLGFYILVIVSYIIMNFSITLPLISFN